MVAVFGPHWVVSGAAIWESRLKESLRLSEQANEVTLRIVVRMRIFMVLPVYSADSCVRLSHLSYFLYGYLRTFQGTVVIFQDILRRFFGA